MKPSKDEVNAYWENYNEEVEKNCVRSMQIWSRILACDKAIGMCNRYNVSSWDRVSEKDWVALRAGGHKEQRQLQEKADEMEKERKDFIETLYI